MFLAIKDTFNYGSKELIFLDKNYVSVIVLINFTCFS